jgi:Flp pilus assembly protein TadG
VSRVREERGAVAIIVAASLTMLIGFAALAIDLGFIYNWRRASQNAADHASLAAAWAWCHGQDPDAAGLASASDNGFDNNGTSNTVSVTDLGSGQFKATITSFFDSLFASVIGQDDLQTTADAVAGCLAGGSEPYALFAKGDNCGDKAIDWSGSGNHVIGKIHSNDGILVGGQNNVVEGQTTYYGDIQQEEDDSFTPEPLQVSEPIDEYPVDFQVGDYAPGGPMANAAQAAGQYYNAGSQKIDAGWLKSNTSYNDTSKTLATGLYFTTGEIDLGDQGMNGFATLVSSNGLIKLGGSQLALQPWDPDGLLLFSTMSPSDKCNTPVIEVSGSQSSLKGILYGPNGLVAMPGSGPPLVGSTLEGSLIGWAVRLSGQSLTINAPENTGGDEPPKVSLLV